MSSENSLNALRTDLAEITLRIFDLCANRLVLARKIGEIKSQKNLSIESPRVEQDLKKKVLHICKSRNMNEDFCLRMLELLLEESKRVQRQTVKPMQHDDMKKE